MSKEEIEDLLSVPVKWLPRVQKNGRLEEDRVTLIEARSPVKIIEPYWK